MLTIGSLFSGIGGLELGLERAGLGPVLWQVEIDPFCRAVLAKHWPAVKRYEDVAAVEGGALDPVELICGGFPCQDVSGLGKRAGMEGSRSGLWTHFDRLIGEVGPRYVVVENVPGLASLGLDRVLGDLAARGFDAEWFPLSATDVGAPHRRERIFVVAYPSGVGPLDAPEVGEVGRERPGVHAWGEAIEPHLLRGVHGVPDRVDRIHALGNAVVPQVAEVVGHVVRAIHGAPPSPARVEGP